MDKLAALALVVAAYGAGLATWSAFREAGKDKRILDVYLREQETQIRKGSDGTRCLWRYKVRVTATNRGRRPLTIASLALVDKDGSHVDISGPVISGDGRAKLRVGSGPDLPLTLAESQTREFAFDLSAIERRRPRADDLAYARGPFVGVEFFWNETSVGARFDRVDLRACTRRGRAKASKR